MLCPDLTAGMPIGAAVSLLFARPHSRSRCSLRAPSFARMLALACQQKV